MTRDAAHLENSEGSIIFEALPKVSITHDVDDGVGCFKDVGDEEVMGFVRVSIQGYIVEDFTDRTETRDDLFFRRHDGFVVGLEDRGLFAGLGHAISWLQYIASMDIMDTISGRCQGEFRNLESNFQSSSLSGNLRNPRRCAGKTYFCPTYFWIGIHVHVRGMGGNDFLCVTC